MKRLVVLVPGLEGAEGHELPYTQLLAAAAEDAGWSVLILTPTTNRGKKGTWIRPRMPIPQAVSLMERAQRKLAIARDTMARRADADRLFLLHGGADVRFILHTSPYPEMRLYIEAFASGALAGDLGRLSVVARNDHNDHLPRMEQIEAAFAPARDAPVDLFADSGQLAALLSPLAPKPLAVAPAPSNVQPRIGAAPAKIAYFGARRSVKGFALLPAALSAAMHAAPDLTAFVQAYRHPHDLRDGACEAALASLRGMSGVTVHTETLGADAYAQALVCAAAVVLPYDLLAYRAGTSGVFVEAICAGLGAAVPEGTWMADEARKAGLSRVVVCPDFLDPAASGAAIVEAVRRGQAPFVPTAAEQAWIAARTPQALLRALTGQH